MLFKDYLYSSNISVPAVQYCSTCQCQELVFSKEQNILYKEISGKNRWTSSEKDFGMCPIKILRPTIYSCCES